MWLAASRSRFRVESRRPPHRSGSEQVGNCGREEVPQVRTNEIKRNSSARIRKQPTDRRGKDPAVEFDLWLFRGAAESVRT